MLNDQLKNAIKNNDLEKAKDILVLIDPSQINLDKSEIKECIFKHKSRELFELISSYKELRPDKREWQSWLEKAIDLGSSELLGPICKYFNIDDSKVLTNLLSSSYLKTDTKKVKFILQYLLKDFSQNKNFSEEIDKCIDIYRDTNDIDLRIITAMQYEYMRHGENSFEYGLRKSLLSLQDPNLANFKPDQLFQHLRDEESRIHDYFGSNLSDDSDSELSSEELMPDEIELYGKFANNAKIVTALKKLDSLSNFEEEKYDDVINKISKVLTPIKLQHEHVQSEKEDLDSLNEFIKKDNNQTPLGDFLSLISTKFTLHFFRGISYYTTIWNQPSRIYNRDDIEILKPLYSGEVYYNFSGIKSNPSFTTSENARRAINHAMGIEIQTGYEDKRLRPRWNRNGRAERPYSGKIYSISIPLKELDLTAIHSVQQAYYQTLVNIDNTTISEREASFWGTIDGKYIVDQKIARYPSFDKKYNPKYLKKYGLLEDHYYKFSKIINETTPHSQYNRLAKFILGTYLSNYYEQLIHHHTTTTDRARGYTPIYRSKDGTFSFLQSYDYRNKNCISPRR